MSKKTSKIFGANIRALRLKKGWTQEVLAEKAGVSRNYVYFVEVGRTSPTIDYIPYFAKALGVPPGRLFKGM